MRNIMVAVIALLRKIVVAVIVSLTLLFAQVFYILIIKDMIFLSSAFRY